MRDYVKLFLAEMNKYAHELNLRNTNYNNTHGLSNKYNKSSTADQAKLSHHAIQNYDEFRKIVN